MRVKAWKSGTFEKPSTAYGIRIGKENRQRYFQQGWTSITIEIEDGAVIEALLTPGFWRECPEVRHPAFLDWFNSNDLIRWFAGRPPIFELKPVSEKRFKLEYAAP